MFRKRTGAARRRPGPRPHTAGPRPREIDTVTRRLSIHEHDTAAEATAEPDPRCPRRVLTGSRTHCAETRVAGKPPDPGPDRTGGAPPRAPRPRTGPTRDARSAGHSLTRRVARTEPGPLGAWICNLGPFGSRREPRRSAITIDTSKARDLTSIHTSYDKLHLSS